MATFELDIKGSKYQVEAESESDLPEIAETIGKDIKTPKQERTESVDEKIAARDSAFKGIRDIGQNIGNVIAPEKRMGGELGRAIQGAEATPVVQSAKAAMPIADVYGQLSESPVANVGIEAARDPIGMGSEIAAMGIMSPKIAAAATRGITGEQRGEFGDWYRLMGYGEKTAATLGLMTSMPLDPSGMKQMFTKMTSKKAVNVVKNMARKRAKKDVGRTMTKVVDGVKRRVKAVKRTADEIAQDTSQKVREAYSDMVSKMSRKKKILEKAQKELIEKEAPLKAIVDMDKAYTRTALLKEKSPHKVSGLLDDYYKRNNDIYEVRVNNISDAGGGLGIDDAKSIIDDVANYAIENGLQDSPATKQVTSLFKKYGLEEGGERGKNFSFKRFFEDYKRIRGVGGGSDPVANKFAKAFRETAEEVSPEFSILQKDYAPIMESKSYAKKAMNLFDNNFSTNSVEGFIDRAAKGQLKEGELRWLQAMQADNPGFSKGIDIITDNSKQVLAQEQGAVKAAKQTLEEFGMKKGLIETALEKEKGKLGKAKIDLVVERRSKLNNIKRKRRISKRMIQQTAKGKQNANWIRGIGSSILIYELVTRPVRGMLYKAGGND